MLAGAIQYRAAQPAVPGSASFLAVLTIYVIQELLCHAGRFSINPVLYSYPHSLFMFFPSMLLHHTCNAHVNAVFR